MVLNQMLKIAVQDGWKEAGLGTLDIRDARPVPGGDINRCFELETSGGRLFLKVNDRMGSRAFFQAERGGLERLRATGTLRVPRSFLEGETTSEQFLVMEFLDKQPPDPDFWRVFAEELGNLHRHAAARFGLDEDNYIGTWPQTNTQMDTWGAFYVQQRLTPLLRALRDEGDFSASEARQAEQIFLRIEEMFPPEKPALLHGDLWGGNFMPGAGGLPSVFDPAVYYGCREMDLAMARLFGGFDRKFYWYYQEYFPLAEGWQQRIPLCQLYPVLVHARLFGGSYIRQAATIISEF